MAFMLQDRQWEAYLVQIGWAQRLKLKLQFLAIEQARMLLNMLRIIKVK